MVRLLVAVTVLGARVAMFRYLARRAYSGQARHRGAGRHRAVAA